MGKFEKYKKQDGPSKLEKYKQSHGKTLKDAEEESLSSIKQKTKPIALRKKSVGSEDSGSLGGNILIGVLGAATLVIWILVLMKLL